MAVGLGEWPYQRSDRGSNDVENQAVGHGGLTAAVVAVMGTPAAAGAAESPRGQWPARGLAARSE